MPVTSLSKHMQLLSSAGNEKMSLLLLQQVATISTRRRLLCWYLL